MTSRANTIEHTATLLESYVYSALRFANRLLSEHQRGLSPSRVRGGSERTCLLSLSKRFLKLFQELFSIAAMRFIIREY